MLFLDYSISGNLKFTVHNIDFFFSGKMWSCDFSCIKGLLQWRDILLDSQLQGNLKTSIRNYSTTKLVYVIIRFQVQFGINLHLWVFQKAEIPLAVSASAISAFWKTHKCKLIPNWTRKTVWLLSNNINMKKFAWSKWRKIFLKIIFSLSKFPHKIFIIILRDIICLENFLLSFSQSLSRITMCNLHWCYTFCTGFTLELHCSQPVRIE